MGHNLRRHLATLATACFFLSCGGEWEEGDEIGEAEEALKAPASLEVATANPLGTVSNVTTITCPSGFASGASCKRATVSCPGTANITATYGVKTPSGTLKGTILLHKGSGGTAPFDQGYVSNYLSAGYRIIQMTWASAWEDTGLATKNIRTAACRPSTLAKYIYDNVYGGTAGVGGFCAHGHSGGSGAWGYALAWYGMEAYFDKVLLSSGPVFGDIEQGCKVPNAGPTITICPTGQYGCGSQTPETGISPAYGGGGGMGTWTGDSTCAGTNPTSAQSNANWKAMSIVDTGADYSYPQTAVSGWVCRKPTNNSPAQGQYYYEQITAAAPPAAYSVNLVSNCSGNEGVWAGTFNGMSGLTASTQDMTSQVVGCIKRH